MADIPNTPELELPFTFFAGGGCAEIEQDSDAEIQQAVWCVLAYQVGQRADKPDFGLPDQTFVEGGADLNQIAEVIAEWEPRAVEIITRDPSWLTTMIDRVSVRQDNG